jgi:hypothetical protein
MPITLFMYLLWHTFSTRTLCMYEGMKVCVIVSMYEGINVCMIVCMYVGISDGCICNCGNSKEVLKSLNYETVSFLSFCNTKLVFKVLIHIGMYNSLGLCGRNCKLIAVRT